MGGVHGAEGGAPPSRSSLEDDLRGRAQSLAEPGSASPSGERSFPTLAASGPDGANGGGVPSATPPPAVVDLVRWAALALPLGAIRMVAVAACQGHGRVGTRGFVMFLLWPVVQFAGFGLVASGAFGPATALRAMQVLVIATGVGAVWAVVAMARVHATLPEHPSEEAPPPAPDAKELLAFAWPGWAQGMGMAAYTWSDQVLLAGLRSAEEAGIYGPVATLAPLFGLGLGALNGPFAPMIAERHAAGDRGGLERAYRTVARWAVLLAVPPVLVCLVVPDAVLGLWPHGDPARAATALRVTALAQLACTAVGSVNYLLIMAGRPRAALANAVPATLLNLGLSVWLVPRLGVTGAALANAVALCFANGMALVQVWRALEVHPFDAGVGRVLLAGVPAGLVMAGAGALGLPAPATVVTAGLAGGLTFLVSWWGLGPSEEDRALLARGLVKVRARLGAPGSA
jgi:O-antigen/teichoic acid export membrane protein